MGMKSRPVTRGNEMTNCIVKQTHEDGQELLRPRAWCGRMVSDAGYHFMDAGHAAIACEKIALLQPCQDCKEAVITALKGDA